MKRVPDAEIPPRATSRSVDRVCAVLGAFTTAPRLSLAQLTERTGLPKPTVHRLASSLVTTGFLRLTEDGRYALGAVVGELSAMVRKRVDLSEVCTPALDDLADRTGETVMLAAADWTAMEMTVIGTRISQHTLSVIPPVGEHVPISAGALGKALLMGLEPDQSDCILARLELPALTEHSCVDHDELLRVLMEHRAAGYASALEEYAHGVSGVAVPVLVEDGRPRGSIGVSGPAFRMNERLEEIGRVLVEATAGLRARRVLVSG